MGRSEQAKTLEVDRDLKVLSTVGCVPRVTFLRSLRAPRKRKRDQTTDLKQLEKWVYIRIWVKRAFCQVPLSHPERRTESTSSAKANALSGGSRNSTW